MNNMLVSPLLKVSPDGPVSSISEDLIHLRQGELDGACGPYCLVSALIALGLMDRNNIQNNMGNWKGNTRDGRFRDALYAFGVWTNEGTHGEDLLWLTDFYKRKGLEAYHVNSNKKEVFATVCEELSEKAISIIRVDWINGGAHWLLVVGYQYTETEEGTQATHLLCLDPGQETSKTSLWNAVIEVFNDDGSSVNLGNKSSNFWGMDGVSIKCQVKDAVVLSLSKK